MSAFVVATIIRSLTLSSIIRTTRTDYHRSYHQQRDHLGTLCYFAVPPAERRLRLNERLPVIIIRLHLYMYTHPGLVAHTLRIHVSNFHNEGIQQVIYIVQGP